MPIHDRGHVEFTNNVDNVAFPPLIQRKKATELDLTSTQDSQKMVTKFKGKSNKQEKKFKD